MTQLILSNNAAGRRIHDSILRSISQIALLIKQFTVKQHVLSGRRSLMCAPQLLTAGGGGHRQSPTAIMRVCVSVRYDTHTTAKLLNRISLCTPFIKRYVTVWGRCALGRRVAAVLGKENSLGLYLQFPWKLGTLPANLKHPSITRSWTPTLSL